MQSIPQRCWKQRSQPVGEATEESQSRFKYLLDQYIGVIYHMGVYRLSTRTSTRMLIDINNDSSSSAFQMRSAQKNFHAAITFATQRNAEHEGYGKYPSPDRCWSLLILKMSNSTMFKNFARRKCRFFNFTKRVSRRTILTAIAYWSAVKIVSLRRF